MNMFDKANAIKGMIELCSLTQNEVASRLGVSQSYVANKLRLLNFSLDLQKKILESGVSERHARALLRLREEEVVLSVLEKIVAMKMTVSETEALIDSMNVDNMATRVAFHGANDKLQHLERVIEESVKSLMSCGISVKKKTEYYVKGRYITVLVDEG